MHSVPCILGEAIGQVWELSAKSCLSVEKPEGGVKEGSNRGRGLSSAI